MSSFSVKSGSYSINVCTFNNVHKAYNVHTHIHPASKHSYNTHLFATFIRDFI